MPALATTFFLVRALSRTPHSRNGPLPGQHFTRVCLVDWLLCSHACRLLRLCL